MKKIMILFFLLLAFCSFLDAYYQVSVNDVKHSTKSVEKIGKTFWVPDSSITLGPNSWDRVYPLLNKAAQRTNINLIRTSLGYNSKDEPQITFFILASHSTNLFRLFSLKEGHYPSLQEMNGHAVFLSSEKTQDQQQVGLLKTFAKHPIRSIQPLKRAADFDLPASGRYIVETTSSDQYEKFVHYFMKSINAQLTHEGIRPFVQTEFTQGNESSIPDNFGISGSTVISSFHYLPYLIFVATILLLVYYSFYSAKRIGVMKLHGIGLIKGWYWLIGRLIIGTFLFLTAGCLLIAVIMKGANTLFLFTLFKSQLMIYGTTVIASLIVIPYIYTVRVSDAIKNHRRTRSILVINTVMKVCCILLVLGAASSAMNNYFQLKDKQKQLQIWKNTGVASEYGLLYPRRIGYGLVELIMGNGSQQYIHTQFLYPYLNRSGALYINASSYETDALTQPLPEGEFRTVSVNPNYLQQFPLYSDKGQRIRIAEQTKSWIVLVPEQYKNKKRLILKNVHQDRNESYKFMVHGHELVAPWIENQQIKIIWLKKNQRLNTFDPLVFPSQHNVIVDPIINVVTEKNSTDLDGMGFISGDETSSLKIKLYDHNAKKTMQTLEPTLKKFHLNTYFNHLVSINGAIKQSIADLQHQLNILMLQTFAMLSCSLILVVQNIVIFFAKYRQKFLVRRLLGVGFIYTYKEYGFLLVGTWFFQLVIGQFILNPEPIHFIILNAILMLIEIMVSFVALTYIERSNLAKMLKEEA